MAFLQSSTLNNSVIWTARDNSNSEVIVLDNGEVEYQRVIPSGTGYGKADSVFYTSGILTSGITQAFDLFSLSRSLFGSTLISNFSGGKIKVFNVENLTSGQLLHFSTTGTTSFSGNLLGGSGSIIYPQSYINMINLSGFNIGSTNRYFALKNLSNTGVSYQISIIGNTL